MSQKPHVDSKPPTIINSLNLVTLQKNYQGKKHNVGKEENDFLLKLFMERLDTLKSSLDLLTRM